ncbi:hypothetical protein [Alsobacter sp. R-9]
MSAPAGPGDRPVVITDIDVPFARLVVFFFKAGLAAIPATLAVWLVLGIVMGVLGTLFGVGPWWRGAWMMMH